MEAILPERIALRSLPSPEKQELKWLMPNCLLIPSFSWIAPTYPLQFQGGVGWGSSAPCPRNPQQVSWRSQGASLIFCKLNLLLITFMQSVLLAPRCQMTFHGLFYLYPSDLSHQLLSAMFSNLEVGEETLGSSLGCHL